MDCSVEKELEVQSARRYLYAFGQLLLGSEPTTERLASLDAGLLAEALEICGIADDGALVAGLTSAEEDVEGTRSLYTRLFIGPATPAATPWESTYRSNSKALFRRETLDVRNAYRAQGLLPQGYPRVADDHIAIELGFMAALAERMAASLQAADMETVGDARKASRSFRDEHLSRWVASYAEDLESEAPDTVYAAAARLMADLVERDAKLLGA